MLSRSIIFSVILMLGFSAHALIICGAMSETEDGDTAVTSKVTGVKYIIGENTNIDDTPEVSEAIGTTVCFQGELEAPVADDQNDEVTDSEKRNVASVEQTPTPVLNVVNVWEPVDQTGGGGGFKGMAFWARPDFL